MKPRRVPFDPRPVLDRVSQLEARAVLEDAERIAFAHHVSIDEVLDVRRGSAQRRGSKPYSARAELIAFLRDRRGFNVSRIGRLLLIDRSTVINTLRWRTLNATCAISQVGTVQAEAHS